jgi:hypothetical protein
MRRFLALICAALGCQSSAPRPQGPPDQLPPGVRGSVLQHHASASRDGVYTDAALTRAAARGLRQDFFFSATLQGPVDAQPLYWDGGDQGQDLLLVFTERNEAIAFDPISGRRIWSRIVGGPVPRRALPCGIIDPIGITGTPIIDPSTQILHLDAMTTPDGGATKRHMVYSLSLRDGSDALAPVDIQASVPGFDSTVQNERGALALLGGRVFVPFAGHVGDCGDYRGWVIAVDPTGAQPVSSFRTGARGGGIWGMTGGAAADGALFVVTGNTIGASSFAQGEAILRFSGGQGFPTADFDFFAPANWAALDAADADLGGSGAVVFDVPGPPLAQLVAAHGKDGKVYLADRNSLGGIGSATVVSRAVASDAIITAPSAITTPAGTFLAFTGSGAGCPGTANGIVGLRVTTGPVAVSTAWCAAMIGRGSTIATTTGGGAESIVWAVGAEGDGKLHGVEADTGAPIFAGGQTGRVSRFNAPIVAKGRIYLAGNTGVTAFTVR